MQQVLLEVIKTGLVLKPCTFEKSDGHKNKLNDFVITTPEVGFMRCRFKLVRQKTIRPMAATKTKNNI